MVDYTELLEFYYKNGKYVILVDENNKKFFMKINDSGEYEYITLDKYLEFYNIFCNYSTRNMKAIYDNATEGKKRKKKKKRRIIPKILIGTTLVTLSLPITFLIESFFPQKTETTSVLTGEQALSAVYDIPSSKFELDTFKYDEENNTFYIFDMDYIKNVYQDTNITKEKLYNVLENNNNISDYYKSFIKEYIDKVTEKFPNANLQVFYENLKNLKVIECEDDIELYMQTMSEDSYACYNVNENTIYVKKGYKYEYKTWEYQVIMHEISHALRLQITTHDNKEVRVDYDSYKYCNNIMEEAMNSVFTVNLFDYEEKDIAYQLQSNYLTVLLDCMDNFELTDYVNHSLTYFAQKLDEYNNDDNYATTFLNLIEAQFNDYHNDQVYVEQKEYYPIYDYICQMYLSKYFNSSMSYDEGEELITELINKITYDVPAEYNIDTNRFYVFFNNYYQSLGKEGSYTLS